MTYRGFYSHVAVESTLATGQALKLIHTLAARASHPRGVPQLNGDGRGGAADSPELFHFALTVRASFCLLSKFGVGNPSVHAGWTGTHCLRLFRYVGIASQGL